MCQNIPSLRLRQPIHFRADWTEKSRTLSFHQVAGPLQRSVEAHRQRYSIQDVLIRETHSLGQMASSGRHAAAPLSTVLHARMSPPGAHHYLSVALCWEQSLRLGATYWRLLSSQEDPSRARPQSRANALTAVPVRERPASSAADSWQQLRLLDGRGGAAPALQPRLCGQGSLLQPGNDSELLPQKCMAALCPDGELREGSTQ